MGQAIESNNSQDIEDFGSNGLCGVGSRGAKELPEFQKALQRTTWK